MEDNVYAAPSAELLDEKSDDTAEFYVLTTQKLWLYSIISFGIFSVPWNYLHWRSVKRTVDPDIWPVARAIFSIFFVTSLFGLFNRSKDHQNIDHSWSPTGNAALYIVSSIAINIYYYTSEVTPNINLYVSMAVTVCLILLSTLAMSNAQVVANKACRDANGSSNARISIGNILWMIVGGLYWVLILIGLFVPLEQ